MREKTELPFITHDHAVCVSSGLRLAEDRCADEDLKLTRIRRRVLEILLESHKAVGAYEVLARLGEDGEKVQPPTAYRALAFLTKNGFAHRIERLNAYVACARPEDDTHTPVFLICSACERVAESSARAVEFPDTGFEVQSVIVEAEGLCPSCQGASKA